MKDNRMNKRKTGTEYEELAAVVTGKDLRFWKKITVAGIGEIDLVARDGRYLVFVEDKVPVR